jgi:hypothetical protein
LKLKTTKIKASPNSTFAFISFPDEESKEEGMLILNDTKYKGKQLEAIVNIINLRNLIIINN